MHKKFMLAVGAAVLGAALIASGQNLDVKGSAWFATLGGNVGVGTGSPQGKLEVVGSWPTAAIRMSDSAVNYGSFATAQQGFGFLSTSGTSANVNVGGLAVTSSYFVTPPTNGLYVQGSVGVGTLSPAAPLEIYRANGNVTAMHFLENGAAEAMIGHRASDSNLYFTNTYGLGAAGLGSAARSITLSTAGNVGIGSTNPYGKLDVQGDSSSSGRTAQLYLHGSTNQNQKLYVGINTNGGATSGDFASIEYLQELQHWGPLALQLDGGSVGIGTATPGYKLDVVGDVRANGGWLRTTGNAGWYSDTWGGGWYMQDSTWIRAYNGKQLWVDSMIGSQGLSIGYGGASAPSTGAIIAGSVGIGTTAPAAALQVNGSVRFGGTVEIVEKPGDNGSASCSTYCYGTQWGAWSGSCVAAFQTDTHNPTGCSNTNGTAGLTCLRARFTNGVSVAPSCTGGSCPSGYTDCGGTCAKYPAVCP